MPALKPPYLFAAASRQQTPAYQHLRRRHTLPLFLVLPSRPIFAYFRPASRCFAAVLGILSPRTGSARRLASGHRAFFCLLLFGSLGASVLIFAILFISFDGVFTRDAAFCLLTAYFESAVEADTGHTGTLYAPHDYFRLKIRARPGTVFGI